MRLVLKNFAKLRYIVPYVMDGEDYFLKTIIPSRKAERSREEERND